MRRMPATLHSQYSYSTSTPITRSPGSSNSGGGSSVRSLIVDFLDISDPTPTDWYWEFRDNTNRILGTSTQQNPSFTFPATGTYTVRLRTNNDPNFKVKTITVI